MSNLNLCTLSRFLMHAVYTGRPRLLQLVVYLLSYSRLKVENEKCKRFSILANQIYSIPDTCLNRKLKQQQQQQQTFSQQIAIHLLFKPGLNDSSTQLFFFCCTNIASACNLTSKITDVPLNHF